MSPSRASLTFDDYAGFDSALNASLSALSLDSVYLRALVGPAPLSPMAELARRAHPSAPGALSALTGCAAFVSQQDLDVLLSAGPVGLDALATVALCTAVAPATREAAAELLGQTSLTAPSLAALTELVEGPKSPPRAHAERALSLALPRVSSGDIETAERLRSRAQQVRDKVRGPFHRQELQRAVAQASLHPIVALLVHDNGDFLTGLIPPIADDARRPLLPVVVAVSRVATEPLRTKLFAVFQRRWRETAQTTLSALARTPHRARDGAVGELCTRALGALGALDELSSVIFAGVGSTRRVGLELLAPVLERQSFDGDTVRLSAALDRCKTDAESTVRERAEALSAFVR